MSGNVPKGVAGKICLRLAAYEVETARTDRLIIWYCEENGGGGVGGGDLLCVLL